MIAFDMECSQGHVFEGWFDSHASFEEQNQKDMITCPFCDDTNIKKLLSPVAVKRSSPESLTTPPEPINYQRLAKEIVDYVKKNSEDVGAKFAAEALKIHYGVSEKRNIRGSATDEEEKTLKEEGVEYFKIPFTAKTDEEEN